MSAPAIYARQSVEENELAENQVRLCRATAKAEGWGDVSDSLTFVDVKVSASKPRDASTGWGRMLSAIKRGEVSVVIITDTDRLLRGVGDALALVELGVKVLTLDGTIDTRTADGERRLLDDAVKARYEVRRKSERAQRGATMRRAAGHPSPGLVPFGYRWVHKYDRDERGTRYTVVPSEAAVIRFMSRELLAGASLGGIVRELNDRGETTREGKAWTSTTARRVLLSPFPAALLPPPTPKGERYDARRIDMAKCQPGAWDEILSQDAVHAARHILLSGSRLYHDGDTRAKWLLSGLGRCGKCKGPLRSCRTKTTAQSMRGYRCTAGCFQRPAALIEAYVSEALVSLLSAPGLLQWMPDDGADIDALRARRASLVTTRAEWFARARSGSLAPHEWDVLAAEYDAEIRELDEALAVALQADPLAEIVTSDDVRGLWESMTTARRRAVLGALLHSIEVHPVGKGRRVVSVEATEATVTMGWKRAEHRVSLDTARSLVSVTPRVPDDAREVIAAALSA